MSTALRLLQAEDLSSSTNINPQLKRQTAEFYVNNGRRAAEPPADCFLLCSILLSLSLQLSPNTIIYLAAFAG